MKYTLPKPEFTFAGFTWPRNVADMAVGADALRKKAQTRKVCGPYYHAPKPGSTGRGFYLDDAGQPFTRWAWCDDVSGAGIWHTGWFCDDFQTEKIRGIVARLPHGRFLAGWSMGEHMASEIGGRLFTDEIEAARAANDMAEGAADDERQYRDEQSDDDGEV